MRVAMVTTGYPPDAGGVETYVGELAAGLVASGHEVEVLSHLSKASSSRFEVDRGVRVRRFPALAPTEYLPFSPGLWRYLRANRRAFDLVHAHNYHSAAPALSYLSGARPLVVTAYMHESSSRPLSALVDLPYRPVFARTLRAAAAVTTVSQAEADLLTRRYPGTRATVIPVGVAAGRFASSGRNESADRQLILTVGRLVEYKRVDLLLRAMQLMAEGELAVVGSGPELDRLRQLADELGLGARVRFHGRAAGESLDELYGSARLVVSLSRLESFGVVPLEALAAGVRVVASDVPAHRELRRYDEHGALTLFPGSEPSDLARLLESTLGRQPVAASSLVPSWEEVVGRYEELYSQALARGGTAPTS